MTNQLKNIRTLSKKIGVFFLFLFLLIPTIAYSTPISIEINATIDRSGDTWGLDGASVRLVFSGDTTLTPFKQYSYSDSASALFTGLTYSLDITGNTIGSSNPDQFNLTDLTGLSGSANIDVSNEFSSSLLNDSFGLQPGIIQYNEYHFQWNWLNMVGLGSNSVIPGSDPVGDLEFLTSVIAGSISLADDIPDHFYVHGADYKLINADVTIDVGQSSPVPEPATMILFGIGLLGLAGVSRRKE